jgi:hypothetical protein
MHVSRERNTVAAIPSSPINQTGASEKQGDECDILTGARGLGVGTHSSSDGAGREPRAQAASFTGSRQRVQQKVDSGAH